MYEDSVRRRGDLEEDWLSVPCAQGRQQSVSLILGGIECSRMGLEVSE